MGNWVTGVSGSAATVQAFNPPAHGDKILIPVDGSYHAANAVEFYLKKLHKPGVEIVFIYAAKRPHATGDHAVSDDDEVNELGGCRQEARKTSKGLEMQYMAKVNEYGLENYRIVGAEGHPGECIIKAATLEKPTMIVMGSRGLGPIARTVLGSVSHYVMSHADVPVLIYKTKRSRTYLQPPESFIESI
ncbi:universal stress protein in QAH/OAS sulfhydrylase 3'region-like [Lineus longissimus]|uniref:universal stress protein in QAH/OAS sulfhydrylase 3'region-like n=1 Tax=Lineus longissimus TaxID=88925 RepID=UPI002B4DB49B